VEVGRSVLLGLDRPPTHGEAQVAYELLYSNPSGFENPASIELVPSVPFWRTPAGVALLVAAAVPGIVLLVTAVAGMTTALVATESDADLRQAVALGAPPSLRRRFHGVQAWWHTRVAAVLGSGLGLAVVAAAIRANGTTTFEDAADNQTILQATLEVPWAALTAWIVAMPVLVGLIVAAVLRSSAVSAPRRRMA
jgi:hypothetical protein